MILSDLVPFAFDLQALLRNVRAMTHDRSRVVIHSYSQLWRPVIRLAEALRLKPRKPIQNWVTPNDMRNLLELADFEVVTRSRRILFPKHVPFLSTFLNGFVANVWPLSHLSLTWWVVARPRPTRPRDELTVSVVVPCRNEAGMIGEIIERTPELGAATELLFVEGGSQRRHARGDRAADRAASASATSRCTSRRARGRATPCGSASTGRSTSC